MSLKLVPDEAVEITEEQARAYLASIHAPKLDELRAKVPTMRTSELIGLAANAEAVAHFVGVTNMMDQAQQEIFMAGSVAIADEIDRRVPIPEK